MTTKLPTGWVEITLGQFRSEGSISVDPSKFKNETFELYSVPSFETGEPETIEGKQIGSGKRLVEPGTVLICKINPRINRAWKVRTASGLRQLASPEWVAFRPVPGINPDYLRYFMCQSSFRNHLAANVSGVGGSLMRARPEAIDQFPFSLPPTREQARIVAAIDELFARLDVADENAGRVKQLAKTLLRSRRNSFVLGNHLDALRVEDLQEINAAALPDGWEWVRLDDLLVGFESGKNLRCNEQPPTNGEKGIVKVSAVTWGTFLEDESKTILPGTELPDRAKIVKGDFLFSRANTLALVGACVVVGEHSRDLYLSDKILRFRLKTDLRWWLVSCLRSDLGRRQIEELSSGNQESMRNISQENIRKIFIPMPPAAQHAAFNADAMELEDRDDTIERVADEIEPRSSSLRQSILAAAFRGELVPQDPKDEPASVLLDRIRAQRAATAAAPKARKTVPTASAKRKRA